MERLSFDEFLERTGQTHVAFVSGLVNLLGIAFVLGAALIYYSVIGFKHAVVLSTAIFVFRVFVAFYDVANVTRTVVNKKPQPDVQIFEEDDE